MLRPKVLGKYRNRLLTAFLAEDLALIEPHLKPVNLELRKHLELPNRTIQELYFVEHGITSVVGGGDTKGEIGLIGFEGVTGLSVLLGDHRSPHAAYMQVGGYGQRIGTEHLQGAMSQSATLRDVLLRYAHAFMIQISHSAIANMNANVEQRLARWLLMAHDRVDGDELALTHDLLALMLGTRRPGATVALQSLDKQNLVRTARGLIIVVDREGLEARAGQFYGVPETEYDRMLEYIGPQRIDGYAPELDRTA